MCIFTQKWNYHENSARRQYTCFVRSYIYQFYFIIVVLRRLTMIYKDLTKNCLVLTGVFLIIIGVICIVLSLILEHHSYSLSADRRIYSTQYWLGIPVSKDFFFLVIYYDKICSYMVYFLQIIVLGLFVSCFPSSLQRKQQTVCYIYTHKYLSSHNPIWL